eukprot:TRINITY_DN240_c1_g1_i1.p1 TRINITY_DN240_c1_g1~~TRINITY_DN240_c1_g1_i1.p1  ORF type:complete len:658 (-),score=136.52 TRINITY_DN240_c1_g1_i1:36-2009(-)
MRRCFNVARGVYRRRTLTTTGIRNNYCYYYSQRLNYSSSSRKGEDYDFSLLDRGSNVRSRPSVGGATPLSNRSEDRNNNREAHPEGRRANEFDKQPTRDSIITNRRRTREEDLVSEVEELSQRRDKALTWVKTAPEAAQEYLNRFAEFKADKAKVEDIKEERRLSTSRSAPRYTQIAREIFKNQTNYRVPLAPEYEEDYEYEQNKVGDENEVDDDEKDDDEEDDDEDEDDEDEDDMEEPSIGVYENLLFDKEVIDRYLPEGTSGYTLDDPTKPEIDYQRPDRVGKNVRSTEIFLFRKPAYEAISRIQKRLEEGFSGDNEAIMLVGERGSGKSITMNQIVLWARRNGWLVLWVPNGEAWTGRDKDPEIDNRIKRGVHKYHLFEQPHVAQRWARNLIKAHKTQWKNCRIKGTYEENIDFVFKPAHHDKTKPTLEQVIKGSPQVPATLYDLLDFAANNTYHACEAIQLFRRELNMVTEYPILIAIDGYNRLHDGSPMFFDPDIEGFWPAKLHAQRLVLSHIFGDPKDHGLINGTMVCSMTNSGTGFEVDEEYFTDFKNDFITVPEYNLVEFELVLRSYTAEEIFERALTNQELQYIWLTGDKNPRETRKVCESMLGNPYGDTDFANIPEELRLESLRQPQMLIDNSPDVFGEFGDEEDMF